MELKLYCAFLEWHLYLFACSLGKKGLKISSEIFKWSKNSNKLHAVCDPILYFKGANNFFTILQKIDGSTFIKEYVD